MPLPDKRFQSPRAGDSCSFSAITLSSDTSVTLVETKYHTPTHTDSAAIAKSL